MGVFRQFPYSNFHEMNMDEILKIVKTMQEEWNATKAQWASYKDFIDNYFANLDVSAEVLQAIRVLANSGELNRVIDPVIISETAEWLNAHITPTTPAIDDTLSISGAAADAKATGDRIKNVEDVFYNGNLDIPLTNLNIGYVRYTDLTVVDQSAGTYRYSQLIPVKPGEIYNFNTRASSSVSVVTFYNSGGTAISGLDGNDDGVTNMTIQIPNNVRYIRLSWNTSVLAEASLALVYPSSEAYYNDITALFKKDGTTNIYSFWNVGFISFSTKQIVTQRGYYYSDMIPVKAGNKFNIISQGSTSVALIALYRNSTDTTASLVVRGNGNLTPYTITVDEGYHFMRVCVARIQASNANISIAVNDSVGEKYYNFTLKKRVPTVSFIFDDGVAKDADVKAIFDTHGKKCGFAVYSPVASRYVDYSNDGFEILAHAQTRPEPQTANAWNNLLNSAYNDIVSAIGSVKGWVTPNSAMDAQYRPLVNNKFEYGYTIYRGDTAEPSTVAMNKDLKSYGLWRSSLQSLSLDEQKNIINYAIANNLTVCFYGHASALDTEDYLTTDNLNALLTYCDSVGIDVVTPYYSNLNLFSHHHNDDE